MPRLMSLRNIEDAAIDAANSSNDPLALLVRDLARQCQRLERKIDSAQDAAEDAESKARNTASRR